MEPLSKLRRNCIYFLIGCCLQAISLFLPWYTFTIASNSSISGWNLYLFEQWKPIYVIQPLSADLPNIKLTLWFSIANAFYVGIGIALASIFLIKKDPTPRQENWAFILMDLGSVLSIALIIAVLIVCILAGFYVPYVQIQVVIDSLTITKTYKVSFGAILSIIASSFLFVPVSQTNFAQIHFPSRSAGTRSLENQTLTPTFIDAQKLEDKYLALYALQEESL